MDCLLNDAHKTALSLLHLVDEFCVKNEIKYSLAGDNLLTLGRMDFSSCYPMIHLVMEYDGFCMLKKHLAEICAKDKTYSLHDYKNTKQFYTADIWFVRHSRVKLPDERKEEEFYYGTRIVITPLYYAGDSFKEWKRKYKYFYDHTLPMKYRELLRKEPIITRLLRSPARLKTQYYLKKRDYSQFDSVIEYMQSGEKSEYVFLPDYSVSGERNDLSVSKISPTIGRLLLTSFWNNVERINYCGTECYCIKDKEQIVQLCPQNLLNKILKPKKSQLLLNGGEELRRIQLIQIELLTEFDRICRKYGLKYNINFGTLIGALRHKGFIPWDDDIDVTMYYKDCEKLYDIMKKELDQTKYFYRCEQTERYHHLIFNHLEHKGTTFTKSGRDKLENKIGIFIDIFPMYPAAPNAFVDFFHTRICRFWRTALWSTVGADSEENRVKRWYYRQLAKMGNTKCREMFLKYATKYDNKKGRLKFWTSVDRNPYNVDLVRMDNFTDAIEVEFEGRKFYAPKYAEGTLVFCFTKDWILFPNENDRKPTHDVMMDIGNLYEYED